MATYSQDQATRPLPPPPSDWQPEEQPKPVRRKNRGLGKVLAVILILLLLLSVLLYTPIGKNFLSSLNGESYSESSSFILERKLVIDISSGEINYLCDIPVPESFGPSDSPIQEVSETSFSAGAEEFEKYGQGWVQWSGSDGSQVIMTATFGANVRTVIWDMDAENSGTAADIPGTLVDLQCGNEWAVLNAQDQPTGEFKIWPDNPEIISLADELSSEGATVYENVQAVYGYLRDNLEYQAISGSEPKSCTETLEDGTGDCDDQSILLISLLRSIGIPAWLAFGVLYDGVRDEWGPHAWAEVYMPYADSGGEAMAIDIVNDEFLIRNCNRLEEWKSDGNGDHLSDYYHLLSYNYTVTGPHGSIPDVSLEDTFRGDYTDSDAKVYAKLVSEDIRAELITAFRGTLAPRKVF
ncbi:MAG: transglutaminase-like domain-containing protein [Thermoplasmata archaeon]|nr:transglutaminase-like domain-containing protein [Thermoplasmata archaeon]